MKFLKNFSIRKLLFDRKIVMILSLVVALVFWLIITLDQNPERRRQIQNIPISISTQGTILSEQGIDVVNIDSIVKDATVTVNGPNYIVSSLKEEDIKIFADLSVVSAPGRYSIKLSAVKNTTKSGFTFVEVNPAEIKVDFDYYDTKNFDVIARVDGITTAEGLISDPAKVTHSNQQTIQIRGPRTDIEKIDTVVAYYKGDSIIDKTTTFKGNIILYDVTGASIDNSKFELSYNDVEVSVPVFKESELGIIPVLNNIDNPLLKNYLINKKLVTVAPSKLLVYGQPEKIDSLTSIETSPIDINSVSLKNNRFKNTKLHLEDGVGIRSDIEGVDVVFNLSDFTEKQIKISSTNIIYDNTLGEGINAKFDDNDITIKICGPTEILSTIDKSIEKEFKLKVNLEGKTVSDGATQVFNAPYTVVYPENIIAWEIVDSTKRTVRVSLSQK